MSVPTAGGHSLTRAYLMNNTFSTHAGNFISTLQTQTDPRTGQFMVNLPLASLSGNNQLGPGLILGLCYSPLTGNNYGFGTGFSLGLTQFSNQTNLLELSNGEKYRVEPGSDTVRNHKLSNFRFAYTNGTDDVDGYTVFWNEGKQEQLTLTGDGTFVTSLITSPLGRTMTLQWDHRGQYSLLTQVSDESSDLCRFEWGTDVVMTVWPDSDDVYQITFYLINDSQLDTVSRQVSDSEALTWSFSYDSVDGTGHMRLTGVDYPTGMTDRVEYSQIEGLAYPDASGINSRLPAVLSHTRNPGGGQPETVIYYTWTEQNFLGYNGDFGDWTANSDYLYTTLTDYVYGSTETVSDGNVTVTTERTYNNYHLQLSEETTRQGCAYRTDFTYYAEANTFIDGQPAQFQLPRQKNETWTDAQGNSRAQVTVSEFDESGNPTRQVSPDGTETVTKWYDALGGDGCPAEPNGFVRFMKSQTTTPHQTDYDAPVKLTRHTYRTAGDNTHIVKDSEFTYSDGILLTQRDFSYHETTDDAEYGRVTAISDTKYEKGEDSGAFFSRQDFNTIVSAGVMAQVIRFTGHDGLQFSTIRVQSALSALLLSETDAQGVTVTHAYDKIGRPLSRTVAPETEYENMHTWAYSIEDDGPVTTETDTSGNQLRIYFDGAGRSIRQQRLDNDHTGKWFDVFQRQYNALGEFASGKSNDWLTAEDSQKYAISMAASHDGWGEVRQQAFSDSTTALHENDLVGLRQSAYMIGHSEGESLSTGRVTTIFDEKLHLPVKEVRTDPEGAIESEYFRVWDGLGRLRSETDELENQTERTYDAYGRVLTQSLPDGSVVTRTYAPHMTDDSVASISVTGQDKDGNLQTWLLGTQTFDSLGRVTEQVSGGRTTTRAYDGASALPSSVTMPSGNTLTYRYIPELGNVVSSLTAEGVTQVFSYDNSTGNLLTAKEGDTENNSIWTPSGALKSETFSRGNLRSGASHSYTLGGEVVMYTDITGKETRYERDTFGRISAIADDMLTVSFEYDALGRLSTQRVAGAGAADTLDTVLTYDDLGREISRTVTDSSGVTLTESRTWLKNGLLETKTTLRNGSTARKEAYKYDVRNRLTGYTASGSALPQDVYGLTMAAQTYRYDAMNNLTSVITTLADSSSDEATYHYDNSDDPTQLSSVTHTHDSYPQTITLKYDADGRLTQDETGRILDYDATGRLISVSGNNISGGSYGYDALNRLVSQNVIDGDTRQLYYRAGELVNEVMQQQGRGSRLIKNGHRCFGMSLGDALTLTASDQHDSPVWSRSAGKTEGRDYAWSPYGSGHAVDLLPGFNGERADPVSGTYHLGSGYRAYNPVLMRFNCPDSLSPFGVGGINPYAYCAGDPVNHIDPSGHISWQGILGIVTGAVGLAFAVFTAGASIAAAGAVMGALGTASATSLVVGGLGVAADVTAIASGAVEENDPHASSVLGWVSMGLGLTGMTAGIGRSGLKSVISSANQRANVVLGGTMKNLDSLGRDFYLFDDIYKGGKRLNLVAHGTLDSDGTARLVRTSEKNMNASETFSIINKRKNLQGYSNIRTIMCYSGNGGGSAFGQRLATLTGIPVKSYRGSVTANFEVKELNKILLETAVEFGDDGLEHMQAVFGQRRNFEIRKKNPHKFYSLEYWKWNFDPVKFLP